ncbi:type I DNA topoisomerase [Caviibacter abscessus]|uniref:type I DNA topoisomerase n=1 Tax=Caviibacter abscessus TaxID=1766719 RepID=UPI0008304E85|nr:type I DNA topoisomerase [Caviibacter abscessus]
MKKYLVIVESPSKAKTIEKILGKNYEVCASYGHVIDLPKTKLGIDVENGYKPEYKTIKGKAQILKELAKKSKSSDLVYLASDLDREGEAIAWHISNYISCPKKSKRIVFNEITEKAVKNAVANPREIDANLVDAQQARRLLDRIVGYKISPLLWKVINKNASAGRVQSVTLRMICDLEDEIKAFVPKKYWEVNAKLENNIEFSLSKIANEKIDKIYDEKIVKKLEKDLLDKKLELVQLNIKKKTQKPPLVFKTSTLQQSASSYLGFSASKTMRIAQQLYEGLEIFGQTKGLITYMRTDSTRVAQDAQMAAKEYITKLLGKEYVGYYVTKNKNAQDAHEGIRPSYLDLEPEKIADYLSRDQYKLYNLIWKRFITSQLAAVKYDQMQIVGKHQDYEFSGTLNKVTFDGYYKYQKSEDDIKTQEFPNLNVGDKLQIEKLDIKSRMTKAPNRFTEATLVKKLEAEGIGRPSTYASIIDTLTTREYIIIIDKKIQPTVLGYAVKNELVDHFENIMNIKFTANMETDLDKIAEGSEKWTDILDKYYVALEKEINVYEKDIKEIEELRIETDVLDKQGKPMILKNGRFGKYLVSETDEAEKVSLKGIQISKEEVKTSKIMIKEKLEKILEQKRGIPTDLYTKDNKRYYLKKGRFGDYLESEDYENDNKRLSLSSEIKTKLKKDQIKIENNELKIKELINKEIDENSKLIEKAGVCEKCGSMFIVKKGRFGKFLACSNYPECKNIKSVKGK